MVPQPDILRAAGERLPVAIVDVASCAGPRLRAAAAALRGRPVAVVGTVPDAERAADCGLRVVSSFAPPLGDVLRARAALLEAVGGARPFGKVAALGRRAAVAARACGIRTESLAMELPEPMGPVDRETLREEWGVGDADIACVLLAGPPSSGDARLALDVAGRAAMLGNRVVLVVHPHAGSIDRAARLSEAAGGDWCLVTDERVEEPESVAAAADVAMQVPDHHGAPGDAIAVELALRARLPVIASEDASGTGLLPAERRFDRLRPNVGARLLRESCVIPGG